MAVFFQNYLEITPTADSNWNAVSLAGAPFNLPAGTSGVAIMVANTAAGTPTMGVRKTGSTDDIKDTFPTGEYIPAIRTFYIGVDANRSLDIYSSSSNIKFYLTAYFTADAVFFTNATDYVPGLTSTWTGTVLTGAEALSPAAFFINQNQTATFGIRKTGSTDTRTGATRFGGAVVGLNTSKSCDIYLTAVSGNHVYMVGYLRPTCGVFPDNVISKSITANVWEEVDLSSEAPAGAKGAIVMFHASSDYAFGGRAKGSTDDANIYGVPYKHSYRIVGLDGNYILELKRENGTNFTGIVGFVFGIPPSVADASGAPISTALTLSGNSALIQTRIEVPLLVISGSGIASASYGMIRISPLAISGTGFAGLIGTGSINLPVLSVNGYWFDQVGTGQIILPVLRLSARGLSGIAGSASVTLPGLKLSGTGVVASIGIGAIDLPVLIVNGSGLLDDIARLIFAMNTSNVAISEYSNFEFDSFADDDGTYLACNEGGIYELTGDRDVNLGINSEAKFGIIDLDKSGKRCVSGDVWVTARNNGELILVFHRGEGLDAIEVPFNLVNAKIHESRSKTPKGIRERFISIGLKNSHGGDFDIEEVKQFINQIESRKR